MGATAIWCVQGPEGPRLGGVVKRAYRLLPSRRVEPMAGAAEIVKSSRSREVDGDREPMLELPADREALLRPLTDVTLAGSAYSLRGAAAEVVTGLRIGRAYKRVRARGVRRLTVGSNGTLEATAAEPFSRMPLGWDRAYGGRDVHAEKVRRRARDCPPEDRYGSFSYPRNGSGRGFFAALEVERLEGEPLPNLDDPDDPVEPERILSEDGLDWIDRPIAASYGPVAPDLFPRCMFYLLRPDWSPPVRPIRELVMGALFPGDLADRPLDAPPDLRLLNAAPSGLAVCRLRGDERLTLWNLHPRHELLEVDLPGARPNLLIEPPGTRVYELQTELAGVHVEPDEDRVTLTWAATMPVAARFPEAMCREMRQAVRWS